MKEHLWSLARHNRVEEAKALLRDNPEINVNWKGGSNDWAALHWASKNGADEMVKLFLAHPAVNVNVRNLCGETPFF